MTVFALIFAIAVPWLAGIAFVLALSRRAPVLAESGGVAWTLGAGWFAGALLLTLWMRLLALVGVSFGVVAIGLPLVIAAALAGWTLRGERALAASALREAWSALRADAARGWQRPLWYALLGWLGLRALLLLTEVTLRPLYPWDAWTRWATKARVFFELGTIVPFADAERWLSANGATWFDAGPQSPSTLPLLQTWVCIVLGRFDDILMNLPWWVGAIALALAIFGAMRSAGIDPLAALAGTWLMTSLPLLDTHVALAGYADLYLAAYFTLAALSLLRYRKSRAVADGVATLLFAGGCALVKGNGAIWIAALVPGAIVILAPLRGPRVAAALMGVAVAALVVLARITVPVAGLRLHLDFAAPWTAFAESLFLFDNWHLLWYAAITAAALGWREAAAPALRPLAFFVGGGLLYGFAVFAFPAAQAWAGDPVTPNRAALVVAPLLCVFIVLLVHAWALEWLRRHPALPAAV